MPVTSLSTLLLVRHGESEWNRVGRIQGQFDSPLTDNGVRQAQQIAEALAAQFCGTRLRLYSSPMSRALETARIIAGALGIDHRQVQVDERLNDFSLGSVSGTYGWDKVAEMDAGLARLRLEDPLRFHPPGGESGAEFRARLADFVAHLPGDDVINLVVSHGVANKFIRSIIRGIDGGAIIALGEGQDTIYRLDDRHESEIKVSDSKMKTANKNVRVELGSRSYDIVIGQDLLRSASAHLKSIINGRRVALVSDDAVLDRYLETLAPQMDSMTPRWDVYRVTGGESAKSFAGLEDLVNSMLSDGIDRDCVVVAFGGGVVGDVAGFASAVLMRGIELIQVPTTLMSQVDSAVGGKNAINTRHGKNLVGSFLQPRIVLNDVNTLGSLPMDEFLSGYGEIIKYGLLRGEQEFSWLEDNVDRIVARDPQTLIEVSRMGCETKANIVSEDELDKGRRALVNLGHTFAHAFETQAGFGAFPHGNAVAVGCIAACRLSELSGHCGPGLARRVEIHARAAGLPVNLNELSPKVDWYADSLLVSMLHDKKTVGGHIHFVLLAGVGRAFVTAEVESEAVSQVLSELGAGRDAGVINQ